MEENQKYKVIRELVDHPNGNKDRAALALRSHCTSCAIHVLLCFLIKAGI